MYRSIFAAFLFGHAQAEILPLAQEPLVALVKEMPAHTEISCFPGGKMAKLDAETTALFEKTKAAATLRIDWLNQPAAAVEFTTTAEQPGKLIRSSYHIGQTHITRTIAVTPDAIFLHFLADKPGDISFRATLVVPENDTTTLENRREIAWTSKDQPAVKARVWIVPFESDVESEGKAIALRGEGECLVVLNFTATETPDRPMAATWSRLAAVYDPAGDPPDPTKIWQAILAKVSAP